MRSPLLLTALLALTLHGCATQPTVADGALADSAHPYDGWWTAQLQTTTRQQKAGNWIITCDDMAGEFAFEVVESVVHMSLLGEEVAQPLSRGGKFTLEKDTAYAFEEAPSSDSALNRGGVTLVIKGKLAGANPRGTLTERIEQLWGGCRTKIRYVRDAGAEEQQG
ncbi:MAG: hypothetical protein AAGA11_15165 [Pseudomonadota bacterium]